MVLPLLACSQGNDLGFWEGTPDKLNGCKLFTIVKRVGDPPLTVVTNITDCYGNEQRISIGVADGSSVTVCSMTTPSTSPLIASVTQTGWCTDPVGPSFDFWLDGIEPCAAPVYIQSVSIYSADVGGSNRNLIYTNNSPAGITGQGNAATIFDSNTSQGYYVVVVSARKVTPNQNTAIYINPGFSERLVFDSESFQTKEIIIEKRAFYLNIRGGIFIC